MSNSYHTTNIERDTLENDNFRKVIWTGTYMQLVLMSLNPGESIGVETHPYVDQFFRVEEGTAKAVVDGIEHELKEDSVLIVSAGEEHNITNTGSEVLKLYTIYTPPNHIEGRIHQTKQDAIDDLEDEKFGHGA